MWKYGSERESEGLSRVLLHLPNFCVEGLLRTSEIKTVTCRQVTLRHFKCMLRNITGWSMDTNRTYSKTAVCIVPIPIWFSPTDSHYHLSSGDDGNENKGIWFPLPTTIRKEVAENCKNGSEFASGLVRRVGCRRKGRNTKTVQLSTVWEGAGKKEKHWDPCNMPSKPRTWSQSLKGWSWRRTGAHSGGSWKLEQSQENEVMISPSAAIYPGCSPS